MQRDRAGVGVERHLAEHAGEPVARDHGRLVRPVVAEDALDALVDARAGRPVLPAEDDDGAALDRLPRAELLQRLLPAPAKADQVEARRVSPDRAVV